MEKRLNIIYLNINSLKEYKNNPRKNDKAVKECIKSIKNFGFKVPILIDEDYTIIAGHTRFKACKELNIKEVPCIVAEDLTEEQIKAFRLVDNKVSEFAEWDNALLAFELEQIKDFSLVDFNFNLDFADLSEEQAKEIQAPENFDDIENIETEHCCPKCGYQW